MSKLAICCDTVLYMDVIIESLKAFIIGLVEGITEWLPISSTGHMIIVDEFINLNVSPEFLALFLVVIQIGAIFAVIVLYFKKLNPFAISKTYIEKQETWRLWGLVVVGCIPAAIVGFTLDDWVNEHLYNAVTVSIALIFYGIVFIVIERRNKSRLSRFYIGKGDPKFRDSENQLQKSGAAHGISAVSSPLDLKVERAKHAKRSPITHDLVGPEEDGDLAEQALFKIRSVDELDIKHALIIGCFQVLAIIPGTSRSGATIIGGMTTGCSRTASAEFTFFLAIPVMFGWGLVKLVKYFLKAGFTISGLELSVLIVGIITAFIVSIISIRFLMGYIKKNDFTAFGIYRIVLGICVLAFFWFKGQLGLL